MPDKENIHYYLHLSTIRQGWKMRLYYKLYLIGSDLKWSDIPKKLHQALSLWHMRYTTRKELARLDHRQLSDIGISPGERIVEARKAFWEK